MRVPRVRVTRTVATSLVAVLLAACGSTVPVDGGSTGALPGGAVAAEDGAVVDDGLALAPGTTTDGSSTTGAAGIGSGQPSGTFSGGSTGTSTGTSGGTGAPQTSGSTGAPGGGSSSTGGGTGARPSGPAEGEPIRVGYLHDGGNAAAAFGVPNPNPGDDRIRRWYEAVSAHLNARGGIGGRPLEPVVRFVDQTNQSEGNQTRLQNEACVEMTEDEKVFMVFGERTGYAQGCYVEHETAFLNPLMQADIPELEELVPWAIPSYFMIMERIAQLLPLSLQQHGKRGEKLGIISFDRPEYRRPVEQIMIPEFERRGYDVHGAVYTRIDYAEIAAQMSSAVLQFKTAGVDRVVVFANGGGLWLIFANEAESQNYRPGYEVSTLDRAFFITDFMPDAQKHDVVGAGWVVHLDIDTQAQPEPTPRMRECWRVINEGADDNVQHGTLDAINALAVCEWVHLSADALDNGPVDALTRADVPARFREVGSTFATFFMPSVDFSAGRWDATNAYANMIYDRECACMRYTTDWLDIPF